MCKSVWSVGALIGSPTLACIIGFAPYLPPVYHRLDAKQKLLFDRFKTLPHSVFLSACRRYSLVYCSWYLGTRSLTFFSLFLHPNLILLPIIFVDWWAHMSRALSLSIFPCGALRKKLSQPNPYTTRQRGARRPLVFGTRCPSPHAPIVWVWGLRFFTVVRAVGMRNKNQVGYRTNWVVNR
jgi:hypothetical protein